MSSLLYKAKKRLEMLYWKGKGVSKKELQKQEREGKKALEGDRGRGFTNKTPYIHSSNTLKTYKQRNYDFIRYVQQNYKEINSLKDITKAMCNSYLIHLKDENKSSYSVETASAAIAKLTGYTTTEINMGIKRKSQVLPIKGRTTLRNFNVRQLELRKFASVTGLRKNEVKNLKGEQIIIENGKVSIDLKSKKDYRNSCKGGRPRIVTEIEEKYIGWMQQLKQNAFLNELHTVFSKATNNDFNKASLHQCRREFARNLYKKLTNNNTAKIDYHCKNLHSGEGYNRKALGEVSRQLGHGRINVVIQSYFC